MLIYRIENLEKLLPNYGDHWILLSTTHPEVEYEDKSYIPETQPNLWYHMTPEWIPDTYTKYLKEKLNIDQIPAERAIVWWNHTVKTQTPTTLSLVHVFHVKEIPYGILADPDKPRMVMILSPQAYLPANRIHVRNTGSIWAQFTAAQLGEDFPTIDRLISLFAVEIEGAIKIIKEFNHYLKRS